LAFRAAGATSELRKRLQHHLRFRQGYDPLFTWWAEQPAKALDQTLERYATFLKDDLAEAKERGAILGDPVGRAALVAMLHEAYIPYGPEELIEIARREFALCEVELRKAAKELGFGDDWRKAQEHVKNQYVAPGEQPAFIRAQAQEAIAFLEARQLLTIPRLAKEDWGMEMLSPEAQKVNPFFLGGQDILVSYPTNTMSHEAKLMSLRGNNVHYCRATVHHELIPGHHLQAFMGARYNTHRQLFDNPFWTEGWPLYWEMRLYDMGYAKSPEDRVGMLFWRMHRCARILFSLGFHLGQMSPQECIDLLVERVGHERDNAEAEVRRSFAGNYGPLYQLAYMVGGLQIRALQHELVGSGKMSDRAFHNAVIEMGPMPIELLRAALLDQPLKLNMKSSWRFAGTVATREALVTK